ncbi:uncharacterized protein LOC120418846 isoform X2 [Culex pipiens pallens]|uniref:uncharacterized protein LOC120418846 isoform X2 n=1 Tax=Culex pipiens pallens TaxID=42434 RepID=UPI0022AA10B4|nr:uncharacterized protein LOC120418846 isoform X2 [Culex pipiens pallens]
MIPEFDCLLGAILTAGAGASSSPFGLMSTVMLNPDLLEMLRNGGFDTRQPARIFLPPKFYSSIVFDSGHRNPEEVFRTNLELMMEAAYDDASRTPLSTATATRLQQHRPNSISYSNGGAGNRNKGSEALEKNAVTNFKSTSLPAASLAPSTYSLTSSIVPGDRNRASPGTSWGGSDGDGGGQNGYNLRSTLPGEPDVDYPILGRIPETSFKCQGRHDGYYADVEARCQVFRVCANTDESGNGFAFLCPNGTLFNQRYFVCDWYMNVLCGESERYYAKNEQLSKNTADFGKMMASVMSMVSFPMMTSLLAADDGGGQGGGKLDFPPNVQQQANRANVFGSGFNGGFAGQGVQPSAEIGRGDVFQSKFNKGTTTYGARGGDGGQEQSRLVSPPSRASEQVYVSSLGTLSTDPQSGFDPTKSAFLGSQIGRDLLPPKLEIGKPSSTFPAQYPGVVHRQRLNEEIHSLPIPDVEVKLIMAKLLKMWTAAGYAKMPTPSYQPIAPILPPSGVLPPSSTASINSRRILSNAVPNSQIIQTNQVQHNPNPNPVTVQNVYRVNKAFVTPEVYYPNPSYFVPTTTSTVSRVGSTRYSKPQLVSRRSDIFVQPAASYSTGSRGIGYEIEVVPAVSYYLTNNQQRQNSYRRGHQRALATPKVFRGYSDRFSSYNVPIGSIGPYYVVNN